MKLFDVFQKKTQKTEETCVVSKREKRSHCIFVVTRRDYGNHDGICHFRSYVYNRDTTFFDEIKSFASLFGCENYKFREMVDEDVLNEITTVLDSRKLKMLRNAEHISIIKISTHNDVDIGVDAYYCVRKDSNNCQFVKL